MTKAEYMRHVEEKLKNYDRDFVDEILENYEQHFEAGLKNGQTEEEICEELGNIENLLGDIQEVLGDKDLKPHDLEKFTAIQEQKEQYNGINVVDLSLFSINVQMTHSQDGLLHVYMNGNKDKAKYLEESISGNEYFAREKDKNHSKGLFGFWMSKGWDEELTLVVEVPHQLTKLSIKTMSGDVKVHGVEAKTWKLETMSGDTSVHGMKSDAASIKTGSGEIEMHNFGVDNLAVHTASGDIHLLAGNAGEAQIISVSGDIHLKEVDTHIMKMKSTSGETELHSSQFHNLNVNSVSGDVEGSFFAQNSYVQTVSGDIEIALERRGKELCARSKTVSGSSTIYGNTKCDEPDAEHYLTGFFSSISGDIEVR